MSDWTTLGCENAYEALDMVINYLNEYDLFDSENDKLKKEHPQYSTLFEVFKDFERCLEKIVETDKADGFVILAQYRMEDLRDSLEYLKLTFEEKMEKVKESLMDRWDKSDDLPEDEISIIDDGYEVFGKIEKLEFKEREFEMPFT